MASYLFDWSKDVIKCSTWKSGEWTYIPASATTLASVLEGVSAAALEALAVFEALSPLQQAGGQLAGIQSLGSQFLGAHLTGPAVGVLTSTVATAVWSDWRTLAVLVHFLLQVLLRALAWACAALTLKKRQKQSSSRLRNNFIWSDFTCTQNR